MIAIIDYGMGNLKSIQNMLTDAGVESVISADRTLLSKASHLILPGVGAFTEGLARLRATGLVPFLEDMIFGEHRPVLGICLGLQLMTKQSTEGGVHRGLGWVNADTIRLETTQPDRRLRIPHMGWNTVEILKDSPLVEGLENGARFYFVHSYHVVCAERADVLMTSAYGTSLIVAAVQHDNICGTQFHPEKSHKFGKLLLRNFADRVV